MYAHCELRGFRESVSHLPQAADTWGVGGVRWSDTYGHTASQALRIRSAHQSRQAVEHAYKQPLQGKETWWIATGHIKCPNNPDRLVISNDRAVQCCVRGAAAQALVRGLRGRSNRATVALSSVVVAGLSSFIVSRKVRAGRRIGLVSARSLQAK